MPTTTTSSSHTTAVDNRGFFFKLPILGLPDPGACRVLVKAAIGLVCNAKAVAIQLQTAPIAGLKERKPSTNPGFLSVDFQKGTWMLPKVAPQNSSFETELFTVYVQRLSRRSSPQSRPPQASRRAKLRVPSLPHLYCSGTEENTRHVQSRAEAPL